MFAELNPIKLFKSLPSLEAMTNNSKLLKKIEKDEQESCCLRFNPVPGVGTFR